MDNQRKFHIFPEKKVSEQEIENIQMFLAGLSQMKDLLSGMTTDDESKTETAPNNQWEALLQSAEIDEYFDDGFNWSDKVEFNDKLKIGSLVRPYQNATATSDFALISGAGLLKKLFNNQHCDNSPTEEESEENVESDKTPLLSSRLNSPAPSIAPSQADTILRAFSPNLENWDVYQRFCQHLRNSPSISNQLTTEKVLCYLIRHIAYQLDQQPLAQYVLDCPVVIKIRELAIELRLHNSNLDEKMRNYQAHKACSEMKPLNDLLDDMIRNYNTYFSDDATSNSSTHFDETQSNHSGTGSDESSQSLLKVKSPNSTQSSQSQEKYTFMPLWLYCHFFYDYVAKEQGYENFSDQNKFRHIKRFADAKRYELEGPKKNVTRHRLESIKNFADISPVHKYFILTELKHTYQLPDNLLPLLEHHRVAAKTEYEYVSDIITSPSPDQASILIDQYLITSPNNEIAKILAYIHNPSQAEGPFSPDLKAVRSLLNIIAYTHFDDKHQALELMSSILKGLEISSEPEDINFSNALILDPSYLTIELSYLNHQKMLSIPAKIFLRSELAGIRSLPHISGITVAYFVLLLNHLKTTMPKEASKPIRDAFKEYQKNVLAEWFSPLTNNNLLRKETDYFDDFLIVSKQFLFAQEQGTLLAVQLSFCRVLLEVLESNSIKEAHNSPTLRHYYRLARFYAKNTDLFEKIKHLIEKNFANLILFYPATEAVAWLNTASIASIEQVLSAKDGDRYFITLLFSWLQQSLVLPCSYNIHSPNQDNSEALSENEIQAIYLCLKENLDHSIIKKNSSLYSKLKEILEKLRLFEKHHHLRAMGAILFQEKDSKKYIDNNENKNLPTHFLQMKKEGYRSTEEYIINCLNYLLLCPLENSSDRQLAASILYPSHDRNEFYFTTQHSEKYHRIPAWMMIQHINMVGIQYLITDLIESIWKNIGTASSAEFRFLIRVIIGHEKGENNLFTQALHNINDSNQILGSFRNKLQAKIDQEKQKITEYAEYIFYAAVRFGNDSPNTLDAAKKLAINCLHHTTTLNSHRLSSSMKYFLKSVETSKNQSYLNQSPVLMSAIQSLDNDQKRSFASLVRNLKAEPCSYSRSTRTKVLNLVNDSISFLKKNSVTQIDQPKAQFGVKDNYLDRLHDPTLLRDTILSFNIGAITFFTHYLSGDDISEPNPLLDTLVFFTMMEALRFMLVFDDTNLNTAIDYHQQPVLHALSQVDDLPALTTASQTLFAALGIDPSSTQKTPAPRK